MAHSHSHEGGHDHSHAAVDHGHTHEVLDGPGSYMGREMPIIEGRDWYFPALQPLLHPKHQLILTGTKEPSPLALEGECIPKPLYT